MTVDIEKRKEACEAVLAQLDNSAISKNTKEALRRLALESLLFGGSSGHLAFVGEPGTGKSYTAHLMGKLLHACGALPTDRVVECTVRDLVSGLFGGAAEKTRAVCEAALGGVLAIDDAWHLIDSEASSGKFRSDFDREALGEIFRFAQEHRGELCIIFTGYEEHMRKLFEVDHWFFTRISHVIRFEPFDVEALMKVFVQMAETDQMVLSDDVKEAAAKAFTDMLVKREKWFGNGRAAREFYCCCRQKMASRLLSRYRAGELTENEKYIMTVEDIPNGQEECI